MTFSIMLQECSHLIPCDDCQAPRGVLETTQSGAVCPDCAENYQTCDDCGELANDSQTLEIGSSTVCEACQENYSTCDDCQELAPNDSVCSIGSSTVCDCCRENFYNTCEDCGDYYPSDSGLVVRDSYCICDSCADNYETCDSCEELYHCSDMCDGFCSSCHEESDNWDSTPVRPKAGDSRQFGVELETSACDDYRSLRDNTVFGAEEDGSITGKEFVSPVLHYPSGLDHVSEFCKQARGFEVDTKCGFHVHIDIADLSLEQRKALAIAYKNTYKFWASLVPKSRRENRFCCASEYATSDVSHIESELDWRRFCENNGRSHDYYWTNWGAFLKYGTLEIRLHTATLNYQKIASWVSAHIAFIEGIREGASFPHHSILSHHWADFGRVWTDDLIKFYRMRQNKWR